MDSTLAQTSSDVDFSFSVERQDGRRYSYNRGGSTLLTSYESASTSKMVSAVIILRLVEKGYLSLGRQTAALHFNLAYHEHRSPLQHDARAIAQLHLRAD